MKKSITISFCFYLYFCLLTGCVTTPRESSNTTIISGSIQQPAAAKIYFYSYADSTDFFLGKQTPLDSAIIEKNGDYSLLLEIKTPHVFSLQCGGQDLVNNLMISPGDQLEIRFFGKKNIPAITPFGKEAKFNTYLLNFLDTFYKSSEKGKEYYIASNYMDPNQFVIYTERRKKEMTDFFNNYFQNDSIKDEYKSYAMNTIQYEIASDRLMYLWKKRMKGEPVTPDASFLDFAKQSFIENDEAFITPSYIRFLNLYLKDTYERMVENGEFQQAGSDTSTPAVEKYKLSGTLLHGRFRDVVIYNLMVNDMKDVSSTSKSQTSSENPDSLLISFRKKHGLN